MGGTDDQLTLARGGNTVTAANIETIVGGNDVVIFSASTAGTDLDLAGGGDRVVLAAGGNTVSVAGIETLTGGSGADKVILSAGLGYDELRLRRAGADTLVISADGATVSVANVESILGDAGDDVITLTGIITGAEIDPGGGTSDVLTTTGNSTLTLANVETVIGGAGSDTITLTGSFDGAIDLGGNTDQLNLSAASTTRSPCRMSRRSPARAASTSSIWATRSRVARSTSAATPTCSTAMSAPR